MHSHNLQTFNGDFPAMAQQQVCGEKQNRMKPAFLLWFHWALIRSASFTLSSSCGGHAALNIVSNLIPTINKDRMLDLATYLTYFEWNESLPINFHGNLITFSSGIRKMTELGFVNVEIPSTRAHNTIFVYLIVRHKNEKLNCLYAIASNRNCLFHFFLSLHFCLCSGIWQFEIGL